jgi:hypothetical protein
MHEPTLKRAVCIVEKPEACTTAFPSATYPGEKLNYCALGYDSCQVSTAVDGPCAAVLEAGTPIFVPAGESLEGLETLTKNSLAEAISGESVNLFQAWFLEVRRSQ